MTPKNMTAAEMVHMAYTPKEWGIHDLRVQRFDFTAHKWETLPASSVVATGAREAAYEAANCDLTGYARYDRVFIGDMQIGTGIHRVIVEVYA